MDRAVQGVCATVNSRRGWWGSPEAGAARVAIALVPGVRRVQVERLAGAGGEHLAELGLVERDARAARRVLGGGHGGDALVRGGRRTGCDERDRGADREDSLF